MLNKALSTATLAAFVALASVAFVAPSAQAADAMPSTSKHHWMKKMYHELSQPVTLNFDQVPLTSAMEFFRKVSGLTIILSGDIVETPPHVSINIKDMRMVTALNWITKLTNTDWVIHDQAIYVAHKQNMKQRKIVKFYDVRDLINPLEDHPGPKIDIQVGDGSSTTVFTDDNAMERPTRAQNQERLLETIKQVIAPESWDE